MPTATRSRMTQDAINELIAKRVEEALKAYDAARNPRTETGIKDDQQDDNVEAMLLNFKGEEVVGLTRWFKKIEIVFHISNCPPRYQVKYASCTLLHGALTWWNSPKRTVGVNAAYVMTWKALMKLTTEVYCHRNEIQKMETELWKLTKLWNLSVKGHPFDIDLIFIELDSFDVIVGMDWLAKYHAVIVCNENIIRIPYKDELLVIEGDGCNGGITAKKTDDKSEEKRLEDVPIIWYFSEVFPKDLPGLPPTRQVKFQIDLFSDAAPVAQSPYHLAPS
ncbi:putative reverse transcriptase domain-containing protein [Tanacetum coccineum]